MKQPNKEELSLAAEKAILLISKAAEEAAKIVAIAAQAAQAAQAAIAAQAAQAAPKTNDHDILIELKTRMEDLKLDIKELGLGTATQINDHEIRLRAMETKMWIMVGGLTILSFATPYIFSLFK